MIEEHGTEALPERFAESHRQRAPSAVEDSHRQTESSVSRRGEPPRDRELRQPSRRATARQN